MNVKLTKIVAALAVLLGIAHTLYGLMVFPEYNLEVVWFMGAGVAMIVTGLANFSDGKIGILRLQNFLMLIYGIAIAGFIQPPQVWLTLALFAGLFILSCMKRPTV